MQLNNTVPFKKNLVLELINYKKCLRMITYYSLAISGLNSVHVGKTFSRKAHLQNESVYLMNSSNCRQIFFTELFRNWSLHVASLVIYFKIQNWCIGNFRKWQFCKLSNFSKLLVNQSNATFSDWVYRLVISSGFGAC